MASIDGVATANENENEVTWAPVMLWNLTSRQILIERRGRVVLQAVGASESATDMTEQEDFALLQQIGKAGDALTSPLILTLPVQAA